MDQTTNTQLALEYLRGLCAPDLDGLVPLLAKDLCVRGPLLECTSRMAYMLSLRQAPPESRDYEVLNVMAREEFVSIYYNYKKGTGTVTIAELFGFRHDKITSLLLVFDTGKL